jgi:PAS domain S-box-containing protein
MLQNIDPPARSAEVSSELHARELLGALPVAVYTTDADGFVTAYNDAAVALWGIRPTLGVTRWCGSLRLFHPDGRPMPHEECPMALALRDNAEVSGAEAIAEREDGSRVPFMAYPVVLRDGDGRIVGAVNTLVDLTEQKKVMEAKQRLAAIVDWSNDAIVSKDLNGIVHTWNASAERVFGYTADEMVGRSITMVIPEDRLDEEQMILSKIRSGEVVDHFETIRRRKDGVLLPVSLTISPVRTDDGRIVGVSKIARDISAQKEAEQRINMLLREVNHRVKNQFAVIISMVREVGKRVSTPESYNSDVQLRIHALSRSHDLLVEGDWQGATVRDLILAHLQPFGSEEAAQLAGPEIVLRPNAVQYLGMAFHELATNAAKYGALSDEGGRILVEWSVTFDESAAGRLVLTWKENCIPSASEPAREGFGRLVLTRVAPAAIDGKAELAYEPDGLRWQLEAPLANVKATPLEHEMHVA